METETRPESARPGSRESRTVQGGVCQKVAPRVWASRVRVKTSPGGKVRILLQRFLSWCLDWLYMLRVKKFFGFSAAHVPQHTDGHLCCSLETDQNPWDSGALTLVWKFRMFGCWQLQWQAAKRMKKGVHCLWEKESETKLLLLLLLLSRFSLVRLCETS